MYPQIFPVRDLCVHRSFLWMRVCIAPITRIGKETRSECSTCSVREFFIDNLLVRIHFIIVMIRWTSLAPWEFEFPTW